MKKIVIFGSGYVGLSNAVLLSQHNQVVTVDIDEEKVKLINSGKSPIVDKEIQDYLDRGGLNLVATTDGLTEVGDADFIVICTPTNYDSSTNYFDTSSVISVIESVSKIKPSATFIIKSTIPLPHRCRRQHRKSKRVCFFVVGRSCQKRHPRHIHKLDRGRSYQTFLQHLFSYESFLL